jgi:excisionase family DNA binding protein
MCAKVRCIMTSDGASQGGQRPPGDISEVKFLTVAEVATVMRVSKMTVYRLVHSGELPAVRVGRSFRVPEKDVDEYLRKSFFQTG